MKNYIKYFIMITTMVQLHAQTDISLSGGDMFHALTVSQNIVKGVGLQASYVNFESVDKANAAINYNYRIGTRIEIVPYVGVDMLLKTDFDTPQKFGAVYGVNIDYEVFKNVFLSVGSNNYTFLNGGIKLRVSNLKNKCKCNWKKR